MKQLWIGLGRVSFWVCFPLLLIYLRLRSRTRILVTAGDMVLVVKPWLGDGRWILPGGGMVGGETALVCAQRELEEETGLKLAASQLKSAGRFVYRSRGIRFLCLCFVVSLGQALPLKRSRLELVDVQWISHHDLHKGNAAPDVLRLLAAWPR